MRLFGLAALVLAAACETPQRPRWVVEVAYEGGAKLGGCAIGDADSGSPGNEIVAVSALGEVILLRRGDGVWTHEILARFAGEMIQCAIGDADPSRPGLEVVAVGMKQGGENDGGPGAAMMIYRDSEGWRARMLLEDTALLHAVCIGDFDPDHPGNEVFVGGYSMRAHVLAGERVASIPLPGPAKSAVPYRGGVAVACKDGSIVHVTKGAGEWQASLLDKAPAGQARIGTDGSRLIVSRDDGVLAILEGAKRTEIHVESSKLRGAVLADLDPNIPGLEAATAGYEKTVTVISASGAPEIVHAEEDRFHHLAAGELPSAGLSLAACGYSGRVVVISRGDRR
jgi:hypothetical protein